MSTRKQHDVTREAATAFQRQVEAGQAAQQARNAAGKPKEGHELGAGRNVASDDEAALDKLFAAEGDGDPKGRDEGREKALDKSTEEDAGDRTSEDRGDRGPTPESAREWLKLKAGYTESELEGMSDEQIVKLRSRLGKTLSEGDRAVRERGEMSKQVESLTARLQELEKRAANPGERQKAPAQGEDSFEARSELELHRLQEGLDDEGSARSVADYVQKSESRVLSEVQALRAELQQSREQALAERERTVNHLVDQSRESLTQEFPGLADEDVWRDVSDEMGVVAKSARFRTLPDSEAIPKVMQAACRSLGLTSRAASDGERQSRPEPMNPPTRRKRPQKGPLEGDDLDDAVWNHLDRNPGDRSGALRLGLGERRR